MLSPPNKDVESSPAAVIFLVLAIKVVQTEDDHWITRRKQAFFEELW